MTRLSLDAVLASISKLPAMPPVITELIATIDRTDVSLDTLAQSLARDPAVVARILRVANSSYYGLPRQVATMQDALVLLGFANVRTLVIAAGIIGHMQLCAHGAARLESFWRHSIGVACCARTLSRGIGENPNTAFIAGLLHDVGRLALASHYPACYAEVNAFRLSADVGHVEAETAVLGLNHAQVGAALAARWSFPPAIEQAVGNHHAVEAADDAALGALTHVADVICYALDIGTEPDDFVPSLAETAWAKLGLSWDQLRSALGEIEAATAGASLLLAGDAARRKTHAATS